MTEKYIRQLDQLPSGPEEVDQLLEQSSVPVCTNHVETRGMAPHGPGFPDLQRRYQPTTIESLPTIMESFDHGSACVTDPVQKFSTGTIRGTDLSDCYLHMIPPRALRAWGRAFAEGAKKYGAGNWLKGFPVSTLIDHAQEHILAFLEGDCTEDHLGHAIWNLGAAIHFKETRPDLMDLPPYNVKPEDIMSTMDATTTEKG